MKVFNLRQYADPRALIARPPSPLHSKRKPGDPRYSQEVILCRHQLPLPHTQLQVEHLIIEVFHGKIGFAIDP